MYNILSTLVIILLFIILIIFVHVIYITAKLWIILYELSHNNNILFNY